MELLEIQLPYVRFRVACSSGTYIRSLAHSLGMRLGCGAVLTELTREYSHPFGLDAACSLDALNAEPKRLFEWVLPVTRALPHWPILKLSAEDAARTRHGASLIHDAKRMEAVLFQPGVRALLLDPDNKPLALAEAHFADGVPVWNVLRGLWH